MAESNNVPAYLVVCGAALGGNSDEYVKQAEPVAEAAGIELIAGGVVADTVKVLEGALPAGADFLVVERFPSMKALEDFYFSPEYQKAIPLRKDTARIDFLAAVAGVPDPDH